MTWSLKSVVVKACVVGLALSAAGCASNKAAKEPMAPPKTASERMDEARRGVADAAVSPLKDVGLIRPDTPQILARIKYPYDTISLGGSCAQVTYELGQLDAVMGLETYQPEKERALSERGMDAVGDVAADALRGVATDFIPFRSWIRRASGADKAVREARAAVEMGELRRSFLRGYGSALGCPMVMPAPPPQATATATPPTAAAPKRTMVNQPR